jgi:hypothetical protein
MCAGFEGTTPSSFMANFALLSIFALVQHAIAVYALHSFQ